MKMPGATSVAAYIFVLALAGTLGVVYSEWSDGGRPTAAVQPATVQAEKTRPRLAYEPSAIGAPVADFGRPMVTHLQIVDLDRDGLADVVYCEAQKNSVRWIRQAPRGVFTEHIIGEDIAGPAHVAAADVNGTGRLDVLVASMGQIMPNNARIGAVVVLENVDNVRFRKHVLIDQVMRVTDVRAANVSGHRDGRLDLIVGQFGYDQGETRWMKNFGGWQFESVTLNTQSGSIHTPVADFDGDGHVDFANLISQEWEEVHLFWGEGDGRFRDAVVWGSTNEDYGSSGLDVVDLNRDGRPDLIYTNGDGFDYSMRGPRPWHGIQWFENVDGRSFRFHRVGDMPGAYAPCAADLDGDGSLDLVAVSGFADWSDPEAISIMAWLNDGKMNFSPVVIAHVPTQLITAAVGDLDGDGVPEIVTGGCRAFPTPDNLSNITLWRKK